MAVLTGAGRRALFEQAAGLALLAACYPPATLVAALYLTSARPGKSTAFFVAGGLVIVTLVGTIVLIALRAGGLSLPGQHQSRYGLRLALGVVALIAAVLIYRHKPKDRQQHEGAEPAAGQPDQRRQKKGLIARLSADPKPRSAFAVGVVMFGPSITFLAAVQVVASAKADVQATIGAMAMIIVLTVAFAWLPLIAYLIAPDATVRHLRAFDAWLRRHRKNVMAGAVGLIGVLLVAQGIAGLV
jgi:Sap, sulfolipid-1-addressing protein